MLLFQPEGPFPLAEWNTPWEELVLVRGPDVMFDVTDLDPNDDIIEVGGQGGEIRGRQSVSQSVSHSNHQHQS